MNACLQPWYSGLHHITTSPARRFITSNLHPQHHSKQAQKMRYFSSHAPRPTTGALCLPVPRLPMKRKGTDKELPPDEGFSPDPSSEDDSSSDDYYINYSHRFEPLIKRNRIMASPTPPSVHSPSARPSRQAARKASATIASCNEDLPDGITDDTDLLSKALAPMKSEDKDAHKAWVELESDPVSAKHMHLLFPSVWC